MEIIVLLVLGVPIALAVWLIARAVQASHRIEELSRRLGSIESDVLRLKRDPPAQRPAAAAPPAVAPTFAPKPATPEPAPAPAPPILPKPAAAPAAFSTAPPTPQAPAPIAVPPPLAPSRPASEPVKSPVPEIDWEKFVGVKGFAWIGGFALFLGIAFFVKYSFERNWITPELRVALGFIAGAGLLAGGAWLHRNKRYTVGAQTLCATGIVVLYAVTFACRAVYHFAFFNLVPTFLLMVLITATAFLLAVRLNALVVAVLGMLGGFLTPILLRTGEDNPAALFGYIAILDAGLILVALNRGWLFLTALAAAGTVILQVGWAGEFFVSGKYFEGNKILVPLTVLLGFNLLYLLAAWWTRGRGQTHRWLSGSMLGLATVALGFTGWFLSFAPLAQRPWLMFGFVFLVDLAVTALVLLDEAIAPAHPVAGLGVFALLAGWTANSLSNELLNAALVFYFVLAVFHSVFPVLLQRMRGRAEARGGESEMLWSGRLFPPLALLLVLVPIFKLAEVSFMVWPFVLLVDVLAIGLAALTLSILPVLFVLLLTLTATAAFLFKVPVATLSGLPASLFVLGAFAVFFVVVGVWLARRFKPDALAGGVKAGDDLLQPENLAAQLPALSAVLPFLLLMMATLRLRLTDPSPVFGVALLLVALLLGVTRLFSLAALPAVALVCVAALEATWHFDRYEAVKWTLPPELPLLWYLIFFVVFTVFPFLFLRRFGDKVVPWAAAALAGPAQFLLIYRVIKAAYPNHVMGLLPAAFAVPALVGLGLIREKIPATSPARLGQLAWFGGVALFFITLIFPVQFERQWITLGWALEGAALLWLFHRVPHPGLRLTGIGLLIAAFVRLIANPSVLEYHARAATPILNWYLYTYAIAAACQVAGAWLLAPPRNRVWQWHAPPLLYTLGTVLAFALLNLEIADYFSAPGALLTSMFDRDIPSELLFQRDMTYSIAWALFALGLLVIGIVKRVTATRYAAVGLLVVTLIKLFFLDLARLGQLYRIGAFVGVSVIAMLASFAYQRFFAGGAKEPKDL